MLCPTSAWTSLYVWPVAERFEHFSPLELHRCQRKANVIGVEPDHEPLETVSVSPSRAVPEIVGGEVLEGTVAPAPWADPPTRKATAATSATCLHTP
jgi:hypothetical protein